MINEALPARMLKVKITKEIIHNILEELELQHVR